MNKSRINTLQPLRCFAFFAVFLNHTSIREFDVFGSWGVSIFLVLSGFLMTYNYYGSKRFEKNRLMNNIVFLFYKLKRIYLLHIIITIALVILYRSEFTDLINLGTKLILNALLIHAWISVPLFSINHASWYLSTVVLTYFLFPYINNIMEWKYSNRKACLMIFISLAIQIIIGFIGTRFLIIDGIIQLVTVKNYCYWFIYSPLSRFFDFYIGNNLAYIYMHTNHDLSKIKYTIFEIIAIVFVIISNIGSRFSLFSGSYFDGTWYNMVAIFSPSTIFLVYIFAIGRGQITKAFTNKFTLYFAKISSYAYLIHVFVFCFMDIIFFYVSNKFSWTVIYDYGAYLQIMMGLPITVILCEIWIQLLKKLSFLSRCWKRSIYGQSD